MRSERLVQEAERLARDGELGNSSAIQLLQFPHTADELKEVLRKFDKQLTRQARAKLFLEMMAPLPDHAQNQRYEPIFDRHPISGRTYTTATGTVVPNEVQYYNGVMVQIYGECTNVAEMQKVLAGSRYKPVTLLHRDGRETAVAHFWAHNLSDTSLKPYNAMFMIIVVVPEDAPASQATFTADDNDVSSVLSVINGTVDFARCTYTNSARLYYVRLLDSTLVAIQVGRERMGTDKRPGTITLSRSGRQIGFSIKDGTGAGVARIEAHLTEDDAALRYDIAKAAATAGISPAPISPGMECVYPSVARIGTGPIVPWDWRTDLQPQLQRAQPNTVTFDTRSEDGAIMTAWGFQPKVLGYLSHVRGVVTGVPETVTPHMKVRINAPRAGVTLHHPTR